MQCIEEQERMPVNMKKILSFTDNQDGGRIKITDAIANWAP